jgi:hypothetical protein
MRSCIRGVKANPSSSRIQDAGNRPVLLPSAHGGASKTEPCTRRNAPNSATCSLMLLRHRALFQVRRVPQIRTLNVLLQPVAQELQ